MTHTVTPLNALARLGSGAVPSRPGHNPNAGTISGAAASLQPLPVVPPMQNALAGIGRPAVRPALTAQQSASRIHAGRQGLAPGALAKRIAANAHMQTIVPELLRNPSLRYADVVGALVNAAGAGAMGHAEALHFASKLPPDPVRLRAALEHLHQFVGHSRTALLGEHVRRTMAGQQQGRPA